MRPGEFVWIEPGSAIEATIDGLRVPAFLEPSRLGGGIGWRVRDLAANLGPHEFIYLAGGSDEPR